jgi:hypothetical protein
MVDPNAEAEPAQVGKKILKQKMGNDWPRVHHDGSLI